MGREGGPLDSGEKLLVVDFACISVGGITFLWIVKRISFD